MTVKSQGLPESEFRAEERLLESEIERLQDHCVVGLASMERLHEWLEHKRLARQACRVVGESRTGKSVACKAYWRKNPPQERLGEPPLIPVVYWHAPQESGPRDFFEGVLDAVQYQLHRGTLSEVRRRIYQVLAACQVELLIIDEAHRLRTKTFSEVRDVFDKLGIAVVLVGTDRLDAVVRRDEQIYKRFMACHRFHRLNAAQLKATTAVWEKHVLQLPKSSKLTQASIQNLLGTVTQGYIGILDTILREAAIRALKAGKESIPRAILSEVAGDYR